MKPPRSVDRFPRSTCNTAGSMSDVEARARAYRNYAAQIRSVAARCEVPDAKAELKTLAEQLENLALASAQSDLKKRA